MHTSGTKPHMGMILSNFNDSDIYVYIYIYKKLNDIIGYQQFSDAVWKQVFYLNLNYCKQSNSTIVTVHKMLSITQKHMQCSPDGQLQIIN